MVGSISLTGGVGTTLAWSDHLFKTSALRKRRNWDWQRT